MRLNVFGSCVRGCMLVVLVSSSTVTAFCPSVPLSLPASPSTLARTRLLNHAAHDLSHPLSRSFSENRNSRGIADLRMIRKVDDAEERPSRKSYVNVAIDTFITLGGVLALSRLAAVFFAKLAQAGGSGPIWPQEEWNKLVRSGALSEEGYRVLHDGATEPPFSSDLNGEKRNGTYVCAACSSSLFASSTKFDSGSGWPSFYASLSGVSLEQDNKIDKFVNMRSEIRCSTCGGHLGHVFGDGALWRVPGGQRFCVNGAALAFKAQAQPQPQPASEAAGAPLPPAATQGDAHVESGAESAPGARERGE